ncbi:hypothetical protein N7486_003836 [Penicillium sp. IBT 16267x]|nr:hypothetical protein N7486_003836 [Penicillium sp. IBT 16267x]
MGRGMATNLAAKGFLDTPLTVYNRTTSRSEVFCAQNSNTTVASTLEDAITVSDIIFICVGDDAALREIINTSLAHAKNKLFIDCTTVHSDTTSEVANTLKTHGVTFIASPVFGAPAMAEAGQVICVLAGSGSAIDQVKPYTAGVISKANIEFRDADGDYHKRAEPLFAVEWARKDAKQAIDWAESVGATTRGMQSADGYLGGVKDYMGVRGDVAGIYGAVRQSAGLPFEN